MKSHYLFIAPLILASLPPLEMNAQNYILTAYDSMEISSIVVKVLPENENDSNVAKGIKESLKTKKGALFSQSKFDTDIKKLSEKFQFVAPSIEKSEGKIQVTLTVTLWPTISSITVQGNNAFSKRRILKELSISDNEKYNKASFVKNFNKLKEFYIKKGFFESQLKYTTTLDKKTNTTLISIEIHEGMSGFVKNVHFSGVSKEDENEIRPLLNTQKFILLYSFFSEAGIVKPDILEKDEQSIIEMLQNKGFADAKVNIHLEKTEDGKKVDVFVNVHKGDIYTVSSIKFSGNIDPLFAEELKKVSSIKENAPYSPQMLRNTLGDISSFYAGKGYIKAIINYKVVPVNESSSYAIDFNIQPGKQYKVGLIHVRGNNYSSPSVVLNKLSLSPGDIFDKRKLDQVHRALLSSGSFRSVNVYDISTSDQGLLSDDYRDIVIDVSEGGSGSLSLSGGFSSNDSLNTTISLSEKNFRINGFRDFWKRGISAFRGSGQFFTTQFSISSNERTSNTQWVEPYLFDTTWQLGVDLTLSQSDLVNENFDTRAYASEITAMYPFTRNIIAGFKYRFKDSKFKVSEDSIDTKRQESNSGIVTGGGVIAKYNSTVSLNRPQQGIKSTISTEALCAFRRANEMKHVPFMKFDFTNVLYFPLYHSAIAKFRADFHSLITLDGAAPILLPANERYYLGGDNTVRGYKPGIIGPRYLSNSGADEEQGEGGATSVLLSAEIARRVFGRLDPFIFYDAGAVSESSFSFSKFRQSAGVGVRIDIGNAYPITIGYAFPLNAQFKKDKQNFFWSMNVSF